MVNRLSSDLKRTTSSIENRSALPTMDLQPLSFNDDVSDSPINSDFRLEPAGELHSDAELVVEAVKEINEMANPLPTEIRGEMMDFDGIQGNKSSNSEIVTDVEEYKVSESSINSHSFVNPSHQKQLTSMDSGLKVLSIYCAHMANKWIPVLDSQPIQGNEMSVVVYYDRFCDWKIKLDEVDYIGGEESYIDDFLYGLKRELAARIWEYKWKPQTLYGAFRRAVIEETMVKNDADNVLKEMPHPNSIDRGAENVSDKYSNVVLDGSLGSKFTIKDSLFEMDSEPIQLLLQKFVGHNEGKAADGGVVLSLFDLQAYLRPLCDLSMNGSGNGPPRTWYDETTSAVKIVSRKCLIEGDATDDLIVLCDFWKAYGYYSMDHLNLTMFDEMVHLNFDPGGIWEIGKKADRERRQSKFLVCLVLSFRLLDNVHSYLLKISCARNAHMKDNSSNETTSMPCSNICKGGQQPCLTMYEWSKTSLLNYAMCLDTYDADSLANEILVFNFDPGGKRVYYLKLLVKMTPCMELYEYLLDLFGHEKAYLLTVVMPIIPCVMFSLVSHQCMFFIKVVSITTLLKDWDLLEMFDRVVIIKASISLSYSYPLGEQVHYYIIISDPELCSFYVVLSMLMDVVWDPDQNVISFYIIEDNDVLKRKEIGIKLVWAWKGDDEKLTKASAYHYTYTWILACSVVNCESISLLITSSEFLFRSVGYDSIGPNVVKQRCIVVQTYHIIVEDWLHTCFLSMVELCHVPFNPIVNIHGNEKYLSLVECSKDYVADITPLYFDKAWFAIRTGNYEMPWSIANCSKSTFFLVELSCRYDHVALQMAQMLCLIGYNGFYYHSLGNGFYYELGSYTIIALEISCRMSSYPSSVVQGAAMSKIFVWDPGVYHFTTLRTRQFLRGRSCHEWQFYYNFYMYFGIIVFSGL